MPDLRRVLADYDFNLLRLMAELWGVELQAGSQREALDELAGCMLQPQLAAEVTGALPPEARAAFQALATGGRQPLAQFVRRHGELRAMGPARRDRERPWANAPSPSEVLWYRGLIGRAFFDSRSLGGARGPEEFVFIPDDLRSLVYVAPADDSSAGGPAAPPGDPAPVTVDGAPNSSGALDHGGVQSFADSGGADDAVTLLAYLQVVAVRLEAGRFPERFPERHRAGLARFLRQPAALDFHLELLRQLGLAAAESAREPVRLDPQQVQPFLQLSRPERARRLAEAWCQSREWNDLLAMPGLVFEGSAWRNDPLPARQAILKLLAGVPPGVWWSLDSFVSAVKERQPDFQRPASDYDSWYIRDASGGQFLRGFENWDRVDGALVRWLIQQPLAWLGAVELAPIRPSLGDQSDPWGFAVTPTAQLTEGNPKGLSATTAAVTGANPKGLSSRAFRLTPLGAALLGLAGWPEAPDALPLAVNADGLIRAPALASGYDRFQLARISDWLSPETDAGLVYPYRLTPAALARAAQKGISAGRVLAFLERAAAGQPALPALAAALRRWEVHGAEAGLRESLVLRLSSPDLLESLRRAPQVASLLGESLGPKVVEVRPANLEALRQALAELGILLDEN